MRALFDTSVLVAAVVRVHPQHERVLPWLQRAHEGEIELLVASHTMAELYSTLSGLPVKPRISPATAWQLIQENVEAVAQLVPLSPSDYSQTLQRASQMGLAGGIIFDALIARAAEIAGADELLTFNQKDFQRVSPEGAFILRVS